MKYLTGGMLALLAGISGTAMGDEGMWTLDHLPVQQIQQRYGFTPSAQWIDLVQHASVRLAEGCSGSFVSANGLVMTNHHCANGCLSQLSGKGRNYMDDGFVADRREDEAKCPTMEINQLDAITDVTARVNAATAGTHGAARMAAIRAIDSRIEQECIAGHASQWRCDVVSLYHGGRYALYRYRRYQDVRLVFAPEQGIAFFGGDPDNFNFPRYDMDVTFFRAYVDGKPASTPKFLKFSPQGPKAGQLTFVVGNPGSTQRETPWTALQAMRDNQLIPAWGRLSEMRGVLWDYSRRGSQQATAADDTLFGLDNSLKVYGGWLETLNDPAFAHRKQVQDQDLRAWIAADAGRRQRFGDPWATLQQAEDRSHELATPYSVIEAGSGFASSLFKQARTLVRAAAERQKPDAERLPAYRDANLPALQQAVASTAAYDRDYDETTLAWSLEKMRQRLGSDAPFVHEVLGRQSPEQKAQALLTGSRLSDPAYREKLWQGGAAAIAASTDPMIVLARQIDPQARALRKQYEDEVVAPVTQASEAIAQARFARDGANSYPDATFSPRLSFGKVVGWNEAGKPVAPFTDIAGLYRRATGAAPYQLPDSWLKARAALDPATPMDFVTDNDIIGGNSGSPVIDQNGHAVGLIFDGNIHSLGGNFQYDGRQNRAVAVDTALLEQAIDKVYHLPRLARELDNGKL